MVPSSSVDLEVVGDGGDAETHVLGDLGGLDPLVLRARVEGDVEVGSVSEGLIAIQAPEDHDVVAAADALAHSVAGTTNEPQARTRSPSADLLPEVKEVVDVVQGLAPVAILRGQHERGHVPHHHIADGLLRPASAIASFVTVLRLIPCGIT